MKTLLFNAQGRINRALFWKGLIYLLVLAIIVGIVNLALSRVLGSTSEDGTYSVTGFAALPLLVVNLGFIVVSSWAGICLGIKRYHDHDKGGVWVLIQFVPFIGAIWYFVEAGCLRGTDGPNRFGADPLIAGYTA